MWRERVKGWLSERQAEVQFRQKETTLDQCYDGVDPTKKGFANAFVDEGTQRCKQKDLESLFVPSKCRQGGDRTSPCWWVTWICT